MSIDFGEPDEDYEFSADDIDSLLETTRIRSLVGLRDIILRLAENPAPFPYDCDPYWAVAVLNEVMAADDPELLSRLPDGLYDLAHSIYHEEFEQSDDVEDGGGLWDDR